jgi:hypothetical protein
MTGTNFSSWYNQAEGTVYSESQLTRQSGVGGTGVVDITDGTGNNLIRTFYRATGATGATVTMGGVTQADFGPTGVITANQIFKNALAYRTNDFADSGNSGAVVTDTVGTVPTVNQMNIGFIFGLASLNGYIRKIAYYPLRVTNAQLQGLTS